jgi:hypothetical protein
MHLFFYWRVSPAKLEDALQAARQWQLYLRECDADLNPKLYLRQEAERCTVMESYVLVGNSGAAMADELRHVGDTITAPWRTAERHHESFRDVSAEPAAGLG